MRELMKRIVVSRKDDGVEKDMYYYYVRRMKEFNICLD